MSSYCGKERIPFFYVVLLYRLLLISTEDVIFWTGLWLSSNRNYGNSLCIDWCNYGSWKTQLFHLCWDPWNSTKSSFGQWFWSVHLRSFVMGLTCPTWWLPLGWHTQILSDTPIASHGNLWISFMTFGGHGNCHHFWFRLTYWYSTSQIKVFSFHGLEVRRTSSAITPNILVV